jgi:hypothetical protein
MPQEKENITQKDRSEDRMDLEALRYFTSLKTSYADKRQVWEDRWKQARAAVYMNDNLDEVYSGRADIKSPVMLIKVNGLAARIGRILFNTTPIGRVEEKLVNKMDGDIIDLHNDYIFKHQLDEIGYKESQKTLIREKTILGTSVGKVTQEYEETEISFDKNEEPKTVVIKDNTYLRPVLIEEFYSDVNKSDIEDSQANIHSTSATMEELLAEEIRTERQEFTIHDPETDEIIGRESEDVQVGVYKNLHLLQIDSNNVSSEQEDYAQYMNWSQSATSEFQESLKQARKTGFIEIDECYGLFDLDGDGEPEEVICTIAAGKVVIRLEPTPFKHKRYTRPFIVGKYLPIQNCLYGWSNVIAGSNLLAELNASRAQAVDAKTQSIFPMTYVDDTKDINWDGTWRRNGIIKGSGPNGIETIINPNLSNVAIQDAQIIAQDIDRLWSLSPVQEGTSSASEIPSTARGTMAIISQNDMPINDIIDNTIEFEMKKFIEMLLERNITFKTLEDYTIVWDEEKINKVKEKAGIKKMTDLFGDFNVSVLGSLELSNEVAHQQGYTQFAQFASTIPQINQRIDWSAYSDKLLRSFGIKDDAVNEIWLDEEAVQEAQAAQKEAQQQQIMMEENLRQKARLEANEDYQFQKEVDVEGNIVVKQAEASIESATGQKVA